MQNDNTIRPQRSATGVLELTMPTRSLREELGFGLGSEALATLTV